MIVLQSRARGWQARKHARRQVHAATLMQALLRGRRDRVSRKKRQLTRLKITAVLTRRHQAKRKAAPRTKQKLMRVLQGTSMNTLSFLAEARRKHNECVKQLLAFVKRRDPRVLVRSNSLPPHVPSHPPRQLLGP